MIKFDDINPLVAAKMINPLAQWKKYGPERQEVMKAELKRVMAKPKLSPNMKEVISKSLAEDKKGKEKSAALNSIVAAKKQR